MWWRVQKLGSDIDKHKSELEELKKQDPEFFNFLKQNDQDLLKFGEDDEEDEDEEEEGGEDAKEDGEDNGEDDDEQEDPAEDGKKKRELTKEYITSLANSAEKVRSLVFLVWVFTQTDRRLVLVPQGSYRALKSLLVAYRSGCLEHAEQSDKEAKTKEKAKSKPKVNFQVTSSAGNSFAPVSCLHWA